MVSLVQLWLPILLSAVGVFFASFVMHMLLKFWHMPDYHGFSNEGEVGTAIRKGNGAPGMYIIPYCKPEDMKKPEFQEKMQQGPVGFFILRPPGAMNMGKNLAQWFAFCLLVALFAAFLVCHVVTADAHPTRVFRVVGTVAFGCFGFGAFPMAIWWGQPWKAAIKDIIDGLIYAVVTALVFAALWP